MKHLSTLFCVTNLQTWASTVCSIPWISIWKRPQKGRSKRRRPPSNGHSHFHVKPAPVEIGGYCIQQCHTPPNSPVPLYSATASANPYGPQHGPLPSVNHLLCLANPPATLEAALPARTLQSSNSAGTNLQLGDIETRATYQVFERSYHDLYYPMAYTPRSTTSIKRNHSNERYSFEQVHWTRYHKIDLKWS